MAGFTKVNGTYGPIGSIINPFGPGVTVFSGDLGPGDITVQFGPNGAVEKVIEYFTQLGTVAMYQVNTGGAYKVVLYPAGYPVTAAAAQTAIRDFGTVNGYNLSGATVTSGDLIA
jgi:hypothetical protein